MGLRLAPSEKVGDGAKANSSASETTKTSQQPASEAWGGLGL